LVAFAEHFLMTRNLIWFALLDLSLPLTRLIIIFCLTVYSQRSLFVDQYSTGFSRSSRIAHRLSASPVTCRPSLLSPAACLKAAFWDPSSFFYYTSDVTNIALRRGLNVHSYADDTHLYVHCECDAVNCAAEAARLAACIEELDGWALSYFSPHRGRPF